MTSSASISDCLLMPWRGLGGEMEKGGKGERRKIGFACAVVVALVGVVGSRCDRAGWG